ncbi:unnamed protein product [Caenorhabditis auriculariae]|uniref:Uncharacterized protein n=1 Tax=Caenorhabditis auriculariae TaxID=2777116 RepID=A0A8S1HLC9_9PELO|nr:unnamed protein product [Caenorhabditis auriculariae]
MNETKKKVASKHSQGTLSRGAKDEEEEEGRIGKDDDLDLGGASAARHNDDVDEYGYRKRPSPIFQPTAKDYGEKNTHNTYTDCASLADPLDS